MVRQTIILPVLLATAFNVTAAPKPEAVTTLQAQWAQSATQQPFSAKRGAELWRKDGIVQKGNVVRCTTCHGEDLSQQGKHARSGKVIEPMAFSANPDRFTQIKKIKKWLKRNCKWTWGRECTAQEKGDLIEYLVSQ
ncbi:MAG: DUF1924 domain-containing protein [Gammaproteobacteria bacterium]|nr:MAG: DUF1924 domain-containing protein [Gammaproteobacteria bacterium]